MSTLSLKTRRGEMVVTLFERDAPVTVSHLRALVKDGFYNGLRIHRVVNDHLTQFGCPVGDGTGNAGAAIEDESSGHHLLTGTVAMANHGPNTGSSQFFFCWRPMPDLEGKHTVFGRITKGIDVLYRLREGDVVTTVVYAD